MYLKSRSFAKTLSGEPSIKARNNSSWLSESRPKIFWISPLTMLVLAAKVINELAQIWAAVWSKQRCSKLKAVSCSAPMKNTANNSVLSSGLAGAINTDLNWAIGGEAMLCAQSRFPASHSTLADCKCFLILALARAVKGCECCRYMRSSGSVKSAIVEPGIRRSRYSRQADQISSAPSASCTFAVSSLRTCTSQIRWRTFALRLAARICIVLTTLVSLYYNYWFLNFFKRLF